MYDRSDSVPNCEIEQIFHHPSFYWIKSKQFDGKSMHFSNHDDESRKGISWFQPHFLLDSYDISMQLIVYEQICALFSLANLTTQVGNTAFIGKDK